MPGNTRRRSDSWRERWADQALAIELAVAFFIMAPLGVLVFTPGQVTFHRLGGTLLLYLIIGATFAGLYESLPRSPGA